MSDSKYNAVWQKLLGDNEKIELDALLAGKAEPKTRGKIVFEHNFCHYLPYPILRLRRLGAFSVPFVPSLMVFLATLTRRFSKKTS